MAKKPDYVPVAAGIPREIAVELSKLDVMLEALSDLKKLAEAILGRLCAQRGDSNFKLVAYIVFAKAFKTFQAAQLLCRSGYGSDALSLCASLFENVIDLLYIGKAPVLRPLRYMQSEQVAKFLQAEKMLKKKRLPRGRRKAYRKYLKDLTPQVSSILKYFKGSGARKNVSERAKALGLRAEVDYAERYWIYCGHKHTLPMAVSGWTIELPDGNTEVSGGPDVKEVFNGTSESASLLLQLCLIVDDAFSLSLRASLDKAWKRFSDTAQSVAREYPELLK